jgi:THO complex subunit 2
LLTRKLDKETRHIDLLQDCFLPRAMMSALDAHYCLQIIKVMHNNATPGFSTGGLLAEIFNRERLSGVLSQCTAREAENLGRFLYEILKLVAHWHSKEDIYKKEALGSQGQLHGFAVTYNKDTGAPETHQDYEQFRRFVSNWHSSLTWALKACLNSGEYMQIRNSIIVLRTIVPVYPALVHQGTQLTEIVKTLSERESRNDLKLAALSLRGPLKNREKAWVQPQAFRLNQNPNTGNSRTSSARPETPQPGAGMPKLNAGAQEFQPTGPRPFDGQSGKPGAAEDGEIEDEKPTSTKQDVKMNDAPEDKPSHQAKSDPPRNAGRNARKGESKPSTPGPAANPNQLPIMNGSGRSDVSSQPPSRPISSAPQMLGSGLPPKPLPSAPGSRSNRGGRDDDQHGRLDRPSEPRVSRERSPGHRSRARTPERDPREQYGPPRAYRDEQRQGPRGAPADSRYAREEARNKPPREPLGPQQMPGSQPTRDEPRNAPKREPLGPQQMPTSHGSREELRSAPKREPLGPQQMPGPHTASDNRSRNMGPPVQSPHPERLAHLQSNNMSPTQHHDSRSSPSVGAGAIIEPVINPARAALISDLPKGDTSRRRDRDARHDERSPAPAVGPDSRVNGRQESTREAASRLEQDTPTGPRASRAGGRDLTNEPRGRVNRETGPSEPTYGRLNTPANAPPLDTPSGPRGPPGAPSGRGGRNFTAPGSTMNARNDSMASSPAVARTPLNEPAHFADRHNSSQPSTPAAESGPIHPSRMAKFAPPPINTANTPNGGSRNPSSPTGPPPSGPRSDRLPAGTPTGPSPVVGPPSGPAGPERKRGDRQRANINATLQGAGSGPGANGSVQFRGAARNTSTTAPSPSAAPAAPQVEPAARRDGMSGTPDSRADLFAPRAGDDREARSRRYEERPEPRQRGSRHPSRERRVDDEPPRRAPPQAMDDGRDNTRGDERRSRDDRSGRDGGHRRGPREQEQGRRPLPDAPGSFNGGPPQVPPPPPGPPPGPAPEWERGPSRHDGPSFDNRRGGRGGEFRAGGGRREDDRSGGRGPGRQEDLMQPPATDGRKRRHEDGGHAPGGFDAKRRRSAR